MDEKEREIRVGKNRIYLGEDNINYIVFEEEVNAEIATAIGEAILKQITMVEGKANFLSDINKCGKPSSEARKILQKYILHEKIGKVAVFGFHPVSRVLASFFMGTSKKKDLRFFKTKEEAIAWLKGDAKPNV